ncbi:MAG: hypothetical protein L0G94_16965 [Brachybacterium sp.]|uniref:hypothetical protein n=1 Tax=Brachybacterium sp. TaxID=1891286 RepID=UPI002649107B|nr:hypothetical protein [Brachybacterium sp.]MDN5688350.1 hypothetical protein [Brachybacterium sp.]
MGSKLFRAVVIGTIALLVLAGLVWLIPENPLGTEDRPQDENTQSAVMPSDGGSDSDQSSPPDATPAEEDEQQAAPVSDMTDPEQAARAFMQSYPGDVADLADPTFLASLDGVEAELLDQISNMRLEHVDQATGDMTEQCAYTIHGTYQGQDIQAYTIVVARPSEPIEGESADDNNLPYQVDSFDWSPSLLGDDDSPGPAADLISPLTAQQRGDLITATRAGVIAQVLTYDPDESEKERQARLDELMLEPTDVQPPTSRSGRYAMKVEITSQYYSTERGGPITIGYDGNWVDPYNDSRHGAWSLTATIVRGENDQLVVKSVTETEPTESNRIDE